MPPRPRQNPHPPALPSHLSYKSALVLLPPASITPPIQSLRRVHDRNFRRWPPHINLIYPFLAQPSAQLESNILPRLQKTAQCIPRFTVNLSKISHFRHGPKSATIYLATGDASQSSSNACFHAIPAISGRNDAVTGNKVEDQAQAQISTCSGPEIHPQTIPSNQKSDENTRDENGIHALQAALQTEFAECDADKRPFTPHLSLGQAKAESSVTDFEKEVERVIRRFVSGYSVDTAPDRSEQNAEESENIVGTASHAQPDTSSDDLGGSRELQFPIERICVLERSGFDDPFRVVADVPLGN
ncbi:hypothetical protein L228DRAFT_268663 [Xylona heveae TC161]|uniref:Uncharacterized protein n=1 Tax=Xylona heveae (strain CBS 132557 / TC161) TaxID=1328760 RepID=A0A165GH50_XYLHT|nr:hypothetical protein L228DRAFT_268663 [Xylona heveae TC161]KZF22178.1 hypothetical protein L228DRAFT_268663 [Xylona heveae TC161]